MGKLEKAIRLEKKGKYKSALNLYQNIKKNNPSNKEKLYATRSIGACLYYLKEYDKAIEEYENLLKNYFLDEELKNQIEENMQLCFLYGNSTQKAIDYFNNKTANDKQKSESKCWQYWYAGQGCQRLKKYGDAEELYKRAYTMSKELNSLKASFFLLYLAVISLFQKHFNEAEKLLLDYKNLYNRNENNGLFFILYGLVIMEIDIVDGKKIYTKGIKKAKKDKWHEHIKLADELKNLLKK